MDYGRVWSLRKVFSSTSQRFWMGFRSGLCGGWSMCENYVSCSLNHSFTILARWILALSPWNMPVPSGKKTKHWWNNLVIQYIQVVSWPECCWIRPDQLNQPQNTTLHPQACTVGTRHDGCTPSSASFLTWMGPSLWNRVTLDSSDHMTFFHHSRLQSLCSRAVSSLISLHSCLVLFTLCSYFHNWK